MLIYFSSNFQNDPYDIQVTKNGRQPAKVVGSCPNSVTKNNTTLAISPIHWHSIIMLGDANKKCKEDANASNFRNAMIEMRVTALRKDPEGESWWWGFTPSKKSRNKDNWYYSRRLLDGSTEELNG
ncbi:hypothetical protein TNCV_2409651 [Trichonephila clavipes]|nr:hypothetical protein TNCV_2409651 [Trichonephila clavipes]